MVGARKESDRTRRPRKTLNFAVQNQYIVRPYGWLDGIALAKAGGRKVTMIELVPQAEPRDHPEAGTRMTGFKPIAFSARSGWADNRLVLWAYGLAISSDGSVDEPSPDTPPSTALSR